MPQKMRKIPQRMCVGCREMKPKIELIRIVKPQEEPAQIDLKGKKAGRGAYVCRSLSCLQRARKSRALERALDTKLSDEVYAMLAAQLPIEVENQ